MKEWTDKLLKELSVDLPDYELAVRQYVFSLVEDAVLGKLTHFEALRKISEIYLLERDPEFSTFDDLFQAKDDLTQYGEHYFQFSSNEHELDLEIKTYFKEWLIDQKPVVDMKCFLKG
jgi:hypothetical protein